MDPSSRGRCTILAVEMKVSSRIEEVATRLFLSSFASALLPSSTIDYSRAKSSTSRLFSIAFFNLTALGDHLKLSLQADNTLKKWEPLREYLPAPHAPARVRLGPDWVALVGNWLTEWERTGDTQWRDRIKTGMVDIGNFPNGMFQGGVSWRRF